MPRRLQSNGKFKGEIHCAVPMSEYTSFHVGGRVDYLAFPKDLQDLQRVLRVCTQEGVPYFVLGNGTNLLVRDGGIRGLAISLAKGFCRVKVLEEGPEESLIFAEAGAPLKKLLDLAQKKGLSGLEWAAGIPGTVGGALSMNAGACQGGMKDRLESVRLGDGEGNVKEEGKGELSFSYRTVNLPAGEIILGGKFRLPAGNPELIDSRMKEILRQRQAKQPLNYPSAGSVFKNPSQGSAGRLIEEAGLKGTSIGNAQVSEKHANFIINRGHGTAREILTLVESVRQKVFQKTGVWLEMEIRVMGEDEKIARDGSRNGE